MNNSIKLFCIVFFGASVAACGGGGGDSPPAGGGGAINPVLTGAPQYSVASVAAGGQASLTLNFSPDTASVHVIGANDPCQGCLLDNVTVPVAVGQTSITIPFTVSPLKQTSANPLLEIHLTSSDGLMTTIYNQFGAPAGFFDEKKMSNGSLTSAANTTFAIPSLSVVNNGVAYFMETYCNAVGSSSTGVTLTIYSADGASQVSLGSTLYAAGSLNLPAGTYNLRTEPRVTNPFPNTYAGTDGDYNIYVGTGAFNAAKPVCGPTSGVLFADVYENADDLVTGATVLTLNTELANLTAEYNSSTTPPDQDWFAFTAL